MTRTLMHINGRAVENDIAPRTHLGDYLRDTVLLTGTHLGCEHGVCGACTVLIDGAPVRSCITFAVACAECHVTTIEGYDDDPIMFKLRAAFNAHHALQCGFCTLGMLATARDIVLRLPEADEPRVRVELAGNLCRCTGYVGIVAAILDVLTQLRVQPHDEIQALRQATAQGKAVAPLTTTLSTKPPAFPGFEARSPVMTQVIAPTAHTSEYAFAGAGKGAQIDGVFDMPFAADIVWQFMGDLPAVASCLPGARVDSHDGDKVKGQIAIKLGPMSAAFVGGARLERDNAKMSAVLRGAGQDSLSQSHANCDVSYSLETLSDTSTRVHVNMLYTLQGPLAQFSRSGLVKDFVQRMISNFGRNVSDRLGGKSDQSSPAAAMNPAKTLLVVVWGRVKRFISGE